MGRSPDEIRLEVAALRGFLKGDQFDETQRQEAEAMLTVLNEHLPNGSGREHLEMAYEHAEQWAKGELVLLPSSYLRVGLGEQMLVQMRSSKKLPLPHPAAADDCPVCRGQGVLRAAGESTISKKPANTKPLDVRCRTCKGYGYQGTTLCRWCRGTGWIR